jgi:hypothetical protein
MRHFRHFTFHTVLPTGEEKRYVGAEAKRYCCAHQKRLSGRKLISIESQGIQRKPINGKRLIFIELSVFLPFYMKLWGRLELTEGE